MRKTKVVLAKVLTAAMVISSFAGVTEGLHQNVAAETIKKSVSITVGKTKKVTVKNANKKYKVSWKIKVKRLHLSKRAVNIVKVTAKKAGKTTLTAIIKR
ncbi:MAG: hypothetical protein ACLSD6_00095 [Clostridium sp.]